ncbi:hypothetical protein HII31_09377 [Pseudocercospora fuligena]|uniref:Uncharacterized protein n=1 Tax=Pseudocercospora fuligena TaxID=685502 RepID=A0A8H6VIG2_9PEZI|nr:hypothetical protein HII31_09377 [Pseudocercospora fuligena]
MLANLKSKWSPAWAEYSECKKYPPLDTEDEALLTTIQPSECRVQWRWIVLLCITNLLSIGGTLLYVQQHVMRNYSMDLEGSGLQESSICVQILIVETVARLTYPTVDRSVALKTFSRFDVDKNSTFTDVPGPKVDGAWHRLGLKSSTFVLPSGLGAQYGLHPQRFQYIKKGVWHEEKEGYPVVLQALHDLHCVTQHKCHNFDSVLAWALENAEDMNTTQIEVPVPPDAVFDVA